MFISSVMFSLLLLCWPALLDSVRLTFKKVKNVDLYSVSSRMLNAGGQAGGPVVKPPLMRSHHWPEPPATQAAAHTAYT